jgi:hypothetical protein
VPHKPLVHACCLGPAGDSAAAVPRLAFDSDPPAPGPLAGVVLTRGPEARARQLLREGAPRVYLGEAAFADGSALERLAAEFGPGRVGAYAAARRMAVSWTLESESNADFRFMAPSRCDPCWEVLSGASEGTGTEVGWWLGAMSGLGAASLLLRADVRDDTDLDILARIAERHGERLWFGPLEDAEPALADWIDRAGVRRLALPHALLARVPAPEPAA